MLMLSVSAITSNYNLEAGRAQFSLQVLLISSLSVMYMPFQYLTLCRYSLLFFLQPTTVCSATDPC